MAGNRAWQRRGSVETYYAYDAANALIRSHEIPSDTWSYFEYDERGNCRTMQEPAGTTYFDYNSRNLVTAMRFGTGTSNYFWYDAQGRRYALEDSDGLSYFTWDRNGMNLLSERDASGNATADYVHGWTPIDGIGSCLAIRQTNGSTTRLYPMANNHGDVIAVVDSAGSTVARYEYDAWGNLLREDVTAIGLRLGYQSNWLTLKDSPSRRLKLSPTRWYDAETGRFGQRDPLQFGSNLYVYVHRPIQRTDPSGAAEWYFWYQIALGGAAIAVGVALGATGFVPIALMVLGATTILGALFEKYVIYRVGPEIRNLSGESWLRYVSQEVDTTIAKGT